MMPASWNSGTASETLTSQLKAPIQSTRTATNTIAPATSKTDEPDNPFLDDTQCRVNTVFQLQKSMAPLLNELTSTMFFRYYKVHVVLSPRHHLNMFPWNRLLRRKISPCFF